MDRIFWLERAVILRDSVDVLSIESTVAGMQLLDQDMLPRTF